MLPQLYALI